MASAAVALRGASAAAAPLICSVTNPLLVNQRSLGSDVQNKDNTLELYDVTTAAIDSTLVDLNDVTVPGIRDGGINEELNGLGISADGTKAYFTSHYLDPSPNAPDGGSYIYEYDLDSGTVRAWETAEVTEDADILRVRRGAVDPTTGIFYYSTANANGTIQYLYAIDPTAATPTAWYVGTVSTPDERGVSGDMAFDAEGQLFLVTGSSSQAFVNVVDGKLPASSSQGQVNLGIRNLSEVVGTGNGAGVAYGLDGYLYISNTASEVFRVDPSTGVVVDELGPIAPADVSGSGYSVDLATCAFPSSLTVVKNVDSKPYATDQYAIDVTRSDGGSIGGATTTGPRGPERAVIGPIPIPTTPDPRAYTITETSAPGSVSDDLQDVGTHLRCVDTAGPSDVVIVDTELTGDDARSRTITAQRPGTAPGYQSIVCTVTNRDIRPARLVINKAMLDPTGDDLDEVFGVYYPNVGGTPAPDMTWPDAPRPMDSFTVADSPIGGADGLTFQPYSCTEGDKHVFADCTLSDLGPNAAGLDFDLSELLTDPVAGVLQLQEQRTQQQLDDGWRPVGAPSCVSTNTNPNAPGTVLDTISPQDAIWAQATGGLAEYQVAIGQAAPGSRITCTITNTRNAVTWTASKFSNPTSGTAAQPAQVQPGDTITYTVRVTNPTAAAVTGIDVSDDLSAVLGPGVTLVAQPTPPAGTTASIDPDTRQLDWTIPTLAPNAAYDLVYQVRVEQSTAAYGLSLHNAMSATSTVGGPPEQCNVLAPCSTYHATPEPDWTIRKATSTGVLQTDGSYLTTPGFPVLYTITVDNGDGQVPLYGVQIDDGPVGGTPDDIWNHASWDGTFDVQTVVPERRTQVLPYVTGQDPDPSDGLQYTFPQPIPAGASAVISFVLTLDEDFYQGQVRNVVQGALAGDPDHPPADCAASATPDTDAPCATIHSTAPGRLTLVKRTEPAGFQGRFTLSADSGLTAGPLPGVDTSFSGISGTAAVTSRPVYSGRRYVIDETVNEGDPADWSNLAWNCAAPPISAVGDEDDTVTTYLTRLGDDAQADVLIQSGQDMTCTIVNVGVGASLALTKRIASGDGYGAVGDVIAYSYTLRNTGFVALDTLAVNDDNVDAAPVCAATTLAVNAATTCTASHTVTQADIDAGVVTNVAHATGLDPDDATVTSNEDTATARADQSAAVTIVKSSNATAATTVGDSVTFQFLVTNTGNVTITSFDVSDPLPGLSAIACPEPAPGLPLALGAAQFALAGPLAPGASATCTATYTVRQSDVDAGVIRNTATVTGETLTAGPVSDDDTLATPLTETPGVSIVKSSNATATTKAGDTITYSFVVTNTGTVTITSFAVSDPLPGLSAIDCGTVSSLAPLATVTCTATYRVTQADVETGAIANTATVDGETLTAGPVSDDDTLTTPLTRTPAVTIVKASNATPLTVAGDTVTFSFTVTNSGDVTISAFTVTDPLAGLSAIDCGGVASLAPAASTVCTATYIVTQDDVDAGAIVNTATVAGTTSAGPVADDDTVTTPLTQTPAVTLVKSSDATPATGAGDEITFSFLVSNSGNVAISAFTVTDPLVGLSAVDCGATTSLAPGESATCTATYTVTQANVDAGVIENTATVNGTTSAGPVSADDTLIAALTQRPALTLLKEAVVDMTAADPASRADAGDRIDYTLTASNTGNTTLTGVTIADPKLGTLACTPAQPAELAPDEQLVCTGSFTLTQADLDAGEVDNTATADSAETPPAEAPKTVTLTQVPEATLVKQDTTLDMTVVAPDERADAGDTIAYTLTAINAGNVTLTGVTISDPRLGALDCAPAQPAELAPGEQLACTGSATITQAELNAGEVENTATVDSDQTPPVETPNEVTPSSEPALTLTKDGTIDTTVVGRDDRAEAGDRITYTLTASNAGNVTLNGVTISDPMLGSLVCAPAQPSQLDPGASMTCTASHTLTQADIDAGSVDNTATADSNESPPAEGPDTVQVPQDPALTLVKRGALDQTVVAPDDRADVGDQIDYTLTATNAGNVTLTDVAISDPALGTLDCDPSQPVDALAPGATLVCTGTYTLTQVDIDAGGVDNTATADSAETPPTETPNHVPVTDVPALTLTKDGVLDMTVVAPSNTAKVGDEIDYTLTATNAGNQTLTDVTISDPALPSLTCVPTQPAELAPGEQLVCTGTHVLTQADIDAGQVENTATADSGETEPVETPETVLVPTAPALTLVKQGTLDQAVVAPSTRADVGDQIDYTLTATNAGNVTLTGVNIVDTRLASLSCTPSQPAVLAPDEQLVCTGTYTLTQADIDAGRVDNTAAADSDQTNPTQTPDRVTVPQVPALTLVKAGALDLSVAGAADEADVGDEIDYTLTASNAGNTTLTDVEITDATLGTLACTPAQPATLAPGGTLVCTGTYTLTQADIDNGSVDNTGVADSEQTAPVEDPNTVELPQETNPSLLKVGTLDMTVVAPSTRADAGDVIRYTLTASNIGNTTLTDVTVSDPKLGTLDCTPPQPAALAPDEAMVCTGTYTLTQADIDAGGVDNTATAVSDQPPSAETDEHVTLTPVPALTLIKSGTLDMTAVAPSTRADVGDEIDYTLTAANAGNTTLTDVTISDPALGALDCDPDQPAELAPGEELVCTGTHTLTQADIDAGQVDNTATADSVETDPTEAPNIVEVPRAPAIGLVKTGELDMTVVAPSARADVGDTIDYTLTATNTGNTTLTGVTVADPQLGTLDCTPATPVATLAPGAQITCTGSHTITQSDLQDGAYANTASADSDQTPRTETPETVPLPQEPGLTLVKSGTLDMTTVAPAERPDVGDTVDYTLTATNTGNVNLTGVTISDPRIASLSCIPAQPATLGPGADLVCEGSYTLTQADIDAGSVANTASVASDETDPVSAPSTVDVPQLPDLTLTKSGVLDLSVVAPAGRADAGDRIDYTVTATNTGNTTLTDVGVSDPLLPGLSCDPDVPVAALAPGDAITCSGSHTLSQADIDAGSVDNTATGETGETPPEETPETVDLPQVPALTLLKQDTTIDLTVAGLGERADAGDTVDYTLTATNAGNTALTGVEIADPLLGTLACTPTQPADLDPGDQLTCTGTYTLTQADLDGGGAIRNTATADSGETPPVESPNLVTLTPEPALTLLKESVVDMTVVGLDARPEAGDQVRYTLTTTNTGNTTLTGVTVEDPLLTTLDCTPRRPATLAPEAQLVCSGVHTLTQADLNAGHVDNVGLADSGETDPIDTPDDVTLPQAPALALLKQVAETSFDAVGAVLHYRYRVTNTGTTSLPGPVTVADDRTTVSCPAVSTVGNGDGALDPGEQLICTATYSATLADLIAGGVTNTASASAGGTGSNESSATVPALSVHALSLVKSATPTTYPAAGTVITYSYVVTNSGNLPLDGPIGVTDDKTTVTCPDGGLTPGQSMTCTSTYTTTQADMEAGSVTNVAVAHADGCVSGGAAAALPQCVESAAARATVTANPPGPSPTPSPQPRPPSGASIAIDKTPKSQTLVPGRPARFRITVVNTGASPLTGVAVSDPRATGCSRTSSSTAAFATLAPGARVSYTCTRPDVREAFTNVATVVGTGSTGERVTASSSARVRVYTRGRISLRKRASRTRVRSGDRVTFRITVRSHGPAAARDVRVCDRLPNPLRFVRAPGAARRNGQICWTIPRLPAGSSRTLTIVVRVPRIGSPRLLRNPVRATARNARTVNARSQLVRLDPIRRPPRFTG